MSKHRMDDAEFERQYAEAVSRGKETRKSEPQAKSASYEAESDRLIVELKNGATFSIPCGLLPELANAAPEDIAAVELRPRGAGLHWEKLNQDFTLAGLLMSVFGDAVWLSEIGRKGGRVSSESKAAAARANGRKGGRPAKAMTAVGQELLVEAHLIEPPELMISGSAHVMLRSPRLTFDEMNRAYKEHNDAWRVALLDAGNLVITEGRLVNHPSNAIPTGAFLFGEQDEFDLLRNCPADVQEAANSAELALAA
jgi:hypothetical protein